MEKELDLEQYVKDLEKHIDTQAKTMEELAKETEYIRKSLVILNIVPDACREEDACQTKRLMTRSCLCGASRNFVDPRPDLMLSCAVLI